MFDQNAGRGPRGSLPDPLRGVFYLGLVLAMGGCLGAAGPEPVAVETVSPLPCRQLEVSGTGPHSQALTWVGPSTTRGTDWCLAVGPALVYRPEGDTLPVPLNELTIATWNVHGGGGNIDSFLADLRSGRLNGSPSTHFVLLLQEAFRTGGGVPATVGDEAEAGRRVAPNLIHRTFQSIEEVARRNGLHLLYVPSMRNGGPDDPPEDRGNAILSSVPLRDLEAFELPMERERRVAVAATIRTVLEDGGNNDVRLVSLHLSVRSPWGRFFRSFGTGRAEQAQAVVERYGDDPLVILGGDLNTWVGGMDEEAAEILSEVFPEPQSPPQSRTIEGPGPLPGFTLDRLFFRLPQGTAGVYKVIEDSYGSDHYPLVGRIGSKPSGGPAPPAGNRIRDPLEMEMRGWM